MNSEKKGKIHSFLGVLFPDSRASVCMRPCTNGSFCIMAGTIHASAAAAAAAAGVVVATCLLSSACCPTS